MQFSFNGVVLIIQLAVLVVGATFIIGHFTGALKWLAARFRKGKSKKDTDIQKFIEQSAEKMLEDERAATAVYAQSQSFSDDSGYLLAAVAFFFSANALTLEVDMGWIGNVISIAAATVSAVVIWAMDHVDKRVDQYRAIIDLYEKKIGLPKRI